MNFSKVALQIDTDGFRIVDQGAGLTLGSVLAVRYEVNGQWEERQIEFQREAPTLWHPFRKSMFVYTGQQPTRVMVRPLDGGFADEVRAELPGRRQSVGVTGRDDDDWAGSPYWSAIHRNGAYGGATFDDRDRSSFSTPPPLPAMPPPLDASMFAVASSEVSSEAGDREAWSDAVSAASDVGGAAESSGGSDPNAY